MEEVVSFFVFLFVLLLVLFRSFEMEAFTSRDRGENSVGVTTSTSSSVVSETEYFVFHKVSGR